MRIVGLFAYLFLWLLSCLLFSPSWAGQIVPSDTPTQGPASAGVSKPFSHYLWEAVLSDSVDPKGNVDFGRLRVDSATLDQYLDQLRAVSPDSHPGYFPGSTDRLAYWINAHNAIALRLIIDAYPVDYVSDIPGFMTDNRYALGQQPTSLSQIEERLQQYAYHLPGVFFALTEFDAVSPIPVPHAYSGVSLKMELAQQTQHAFNDSRLIGIVTDGHCPTLMLSPWFQRMQTGLMNYQALNHAPQLWPAFLKPFLPQDIQTQMNQPECIPTVVFGQPNFRLRRPEPI